MHFETHAFQNTRERKNLDNGADVRKVVDFQRKGVDFLVKTVMFVTIVGKKKIKGNGGTFALVGRSLVFRPPLTRLRVRAPQRFSIFAFTPSPYPFKPLINNKIRVNIAHRKAFTCLFTAG